VLPSVVAFVRTILTEANTGNFKMFIDENTDRATLERVALSECGFDHLSIEAATDEELLTMITDWIEAGDETGHA
jgi:hypothetical protein